MEKLENSMAKVIEKIKRDTNNASDITYRYFKYAYRDICLIFSQSMTSGSLINESILRFLVNDDYTGVDILGEIENNLPNSNLVVVEDYETLYRQLFSGFTLLVVDNEDKVFSYGTQETLYSPVAEAKNEVVMKGPKDSFCENYEINLGLIRKRIKSEDLYIKENYVGSMSKSRVGVVYLNGIAQEQLVQSICKKIEKIDIDAILNSNYVVDLISDHQHEFMPVSHLTERPDVVVKHLLDGRIAIIVENTPHVIVIPAIFMDFIDNIEDSYGKAINVNVTRFIRMIGFFLTVIAPAYYIAIITYNYEEIPSSLLINLASQRTGIPFPTFIEALIMLITFEILRETDIRSPTVIGSALSIVGALVLGDAVVTAGFISPAMVIVMAMTGITSLLFTSHEMINAARWIRLIFMLLAALLGIVGIMIALFIVLFKISAIDSFETPYLIPISPFVKSELTSSFFLSDKKRLTRRTSFTARHDNLERRKIV